MKKKEEVIKVDSPLKIRLKKYWTILKFFIISAFVLTLLEIGAAYWLVSSRWNLLVPKEQMMKLADEVNEAPPLPENFMKLYTKHFPKHFHTSLRQQIFLNYVPRIVMRKTDLAHLPHCFCDFVYDIQVLKYPELKAIKWDGRLQDLEYGFGIEKYATPEQCFNYVTWYNINHTKNRLNSPQYAHLFERPVASLSDEELLELIVLFKHGFYIKPEQVDDFVKMYNDKLSENR